MAGTNYGAFVPTSNVWDVSEIYQATNDPKLQELLVRLYQNLNRLSLSTNVKDSALYVQEEFVNGQSYFPKPGTSSVTAQAPAMRQVFRKTIDFGALPAGGATKMVAHGLSPTVDWSCTRIYGAATAPVDATHVYFAPIPYSSANGTNTLELNTDSTNVYITAFGVFPLATPWTAFTKTYVVIEYIKT